jgi:homoserine kinase
VKSDAVIGVAEKRRSTNRRECSFEVRVPASTSNLGAGFDCFGLALELYLTVRATALPEAFEPCRVRSLGEGEREAVGASATDNLIFQAMRLTAEHESLSLPPVRLAVHNRIPFGRGLGSSGAAIVAGITLCAAVCGREITDEAVLRYGLELEGHADNIAAALYGGFVVHCSKPDGKVLAVKRRWPTEIKAVVVSPHASLKTVLARSALPANVTRTDAVYNLQRASLFGAALADGDYDLLWEAMQDRLHQRYREPLVPGLQEALATPKQPGLLGLALSGSGPSVIALALDHFAEIGEKIAESFRQHGTETTVRVLQVDEQGRKTATLRRGE